MNELAMEINVADVAALLGGDPSCLLLDCRNQDEYNLVSLEDCLFIPMNELPQRMSELDAYRDRRVIVYCHLGGRSLHVANWLRQQGYQQAQSMAGGIDAWAEQIDSSLARY